MFIFIVIIWNRPKQFLVWLIHNRSHFFTSHWRAWLVKDWVLQDLIMSVITFIRRILLDWRRIKIALAVLVLIYVLFRIRNKLLNCMNIFFNFNLVQGEHRRKFDDRCGLLNNLGNVKIHVISDRLILSDWPQVSFSHMKTGLKHFLFPCIILTGKDEVVKHVSKRLWLNILFQICNFRARGESLAIVFNVRHISTDIYFIL